MNTPKEFVPEGIKSFRLRDDHKAIALDAGELQISIEMF